MKLLLMSGAKVDGFACQTPSCLTPLSAAALYGRTDAARLLLDRGADVNQPLKRGQTALMYAAHYGHVDTVRLLLSRGANVGAECDSMTALEYAKRRGSTEIIDLLTKAGATR